MLLLLIGNACCVRKCHVLRFLCTELTGASLEGKVGGRDSFIIKKIAIRTGDDCAKSCWAKLIAFKDLMNVFCFRNGVYIWASRKSLWQCFVVVCVGSFVRSVFSFDIEVTLMESCFIVFLTSNLLLACVADGHSPRKCPAIAQAKLLFFIYLSFLPVLHTKDSLCRCRIIYN